MYIHHKKYFSEKDVPISPWVFEKAKIIVDKREAKEKEDEKLEKLQQKMIENQNDFKLKFKQAKQRAKSHRDYLEKNIQKMFEVHQKQMETSRLQFENVLASTMETMEKMRQDQQSIIENQQIQLEKQQTQLDLQIQASNN